MRTQNSCIAQAEISSEPKQIFEVSRAWDEGRENDLIDRIRRDPYFAPIIPELDSLLDPKSFVGRCPEQVDAFLKEWVEPALKPWKDILSGAKTAELNV